MKLLNTEKTYRMLQPFESIEQLNANTKAIRQQFGKQLTKATREVLDVLHRYASKYYGVCYLSKSKIADMLGISRRTVIRACELLESLGIVVQYELKRHNGDKRQSSNAIVFLSQIAARESFGQAIEIVSDNMHNHVENRNVTPECHSVNAPDKAPKKDINNTYDTRESAALIKNGLVSKLPKTLKYALAPFFDAEELYEMVGVIYKAKASVDRDIQIEDHEDTFRETILSVINTFKRGKAKSLPAVLYHAIQSTTRSISLKGRFANAFGI
ncbi:helix-turn-helix domain-containing protein [Lysinibacillus xylanilyticus]|uniref:Helix-turn-helix domain-containing protein n=1 Tax=Lysinibacillus xylanilyticus TaxID=582475 RepID=A0ABT4EM73_9BACI|nr:helix-turn-helix domain-containing protein [Lysinibacillus xylanilyticus]MCY9546759.1 helix-turn-helix domain-containing protein [Lysinibacillus xylanilyticus]